MEYSKRISEAFRNKDEVSVGERNIVLCHLNIGSDTKSEKVLLDKLIKFCEENCLSLDMDPQGDNAIVRKVLVFENAESATEEDVRAWVRKIFEAHLLWHFDDDPRTVITIENGKTVRVFSDNEAWYLDRLLDKIYDKWNQVMFDEAVKIQ